MASTGEPAPTLIFNQCILPQAVDGSDIFSASFKIDAGTLAVVKINDRQQEQAVAAALAGLLAPQSGEVRFQGYDWQSLPGERANALRGRIGTVFGGDVWSPYRTVLDGMILPQLHHTRRRLAEICTEATQLCLRLGLPGIPQDFPAGVAESDRQTANFVRALLGEPALIVIQQQLAGLSTRLLQSITSVILERRERGAAIVWFDDGATFHRDHVLPVHQNIDLSGGTAHAEAERV